ncbi:Glucose-6-phosphate isomerase, cytosolic [Galdieria sulphuraria]|nr:Glucose-6-phosphate isomerase, cytosolic [Galdieria sulphuraria]
MSSGNTWDTLATLANKIQKVHLKDLISEPHREQYCLIEKNGIILDLSRQKIDREVLKHLFQLSTERQLVERIKSMFKGEQVNDTEKRAALHIALRAKRNQRIEVCGENVMVEIYAVLDKISQFVCRVRIGGSYLGPEFVYEALRSDPEAKKAADGYCLRFLSNVDPVDYFRVIQGLNPEETLAVIWFINALSEDSISHHMVAVSTNLEAVRDFGIDPENAFGFWDWVGGRYSVCSAVGILPLSLYFGFDTMREFLDGAQDMDQHFVHTPMEQNIPLLMGLVGVWNRTFLGYPVRALLPYSQALLRFPAHIQQVDMESNGKSVDRHGSVVSFPTGPINFGEPGTNGQHSFYQLLHQGKTIVPADFIGYIHSHQDISTDEISAHDELMCNLFAQPDALALGKTAEECNRPSTILLLTKLNAFALGQLLAIFEHRTVVEGFLWDINSFDQWGVELGKVLAKDIRQQMIQYRKKSGQAKIALSNPCTEKLLKKYLDSC